MGHFIGKREQKMRGRPLATKFLTNAKLSLTDTPEVSCVNSVSTSNLFQRHPDPKVRSTGVRAEPGKQGPPIGLSLNAWVRGQDFPGCAGILEVSEATSGAEKMNDLGQQSGREAEPGRKAGLAKRRALKRNPCEKGPTRGSETLRWGERKLSCTEK